MTPNFGVRNQVSIKIQIVGPTRQIFHNYGIHYLTIQPEFSNALGIMLLNILYFQFCTVIGQPLN